VVGVMMGSGGGDDGWRSGSGGRYEG